MKKLTFKQHLTTSIICTAIFALVLSCSGGSGRGPIITVGPPQALPRLFSQSKPGVHNHVAPSTTTTPVLASMFFFAASPSDIPESLDVTCTFTSGFIASVPSGNIVPLVPVTDTSADCSRFFSVAQPASTLTQLVPLFHAGTAQTLVVSGVTAGGTRVRCADLTSQTAVADNDLVLAYLNPSNNTVTLFNNVTALANNCALTVPAGDTVARVTVRWTKL